jgi:hypothetical protein
MACYRYVNWGNANDIRSVYVPMGTLVCVEYVREASYGELRLVLDLKSMGSYDSFLEHLQAHTRQHGAQVLSAQVVAEHPASRLRLQSHNMAVCTNYDYLRAEPPKVSVEFLVKPWKP